VTRLFVRLKWRLWRNSLRSASSGRIIGMVLGAVFGVILLMVFFSVAIATRGSAHNDTAVMAGLATSVLVFAWWLMPLVTGGVDETVDPSRLRLLPLTDRQLRRGQIAAGVIGPAPVFAIIASSAIAVAFTHSLLGAPLVIVALLLCLAVALVGSRAIATGLGAMRRTRRGRELSVVMMVLCVVLLGITYQLIVQAATHPDDGHLGTLARWLSWTPPGMIGRAVWQAGRGHVLAALPMMLPMVAVLLLSGWYWTRALDRLLSGSDSSESGRSNTGGATGALFTGLRRRLPRTSRGAALARELLYLRRSPGRRNAVLMAVVFTVAYSLIIGRGELSKESSVFFPLSMIIFAGANAFNQFGWSPGEYWLDAVSGVDPRTRLLPRRLLTLFIVIVAPGVAVLAFFAVSRAVGALVVALVVLTYAALSFTGVGLPFSMKTVMPLADNGNPWANRKGNGGVSLAMFMSSLLGYVPTMVLGAVAGVGMWDNRGRPFWFVIIAASLLALGTAVFVFGGRYTARRLVRNDADIIRQLETRTVR